MLDFIIHLFNLIKKYFWKFVIFSLWFYLFWSLIFPSVVWFVIMKQDFIFLIASSPFIWKYAIYGFNFFVCSFFATIYFTIKSNI